jgi:hypothetical protein
MRKAGLMLVGALALAACNKSPQVNEKDASVAQVAKKVREAGGQQSFVRPGLWQSKVTIEQFDMPGMPPEMAGRMKNMMAQNQAHGFKTCLTPEDVNKPKEDFFAGKNKECRYDHFTMGDGKIDASMHCGDGKQGTQVMEMAGTYSPDSYQMETSMKADESGESGGGMQMRMRIEAQRVGECTGKES